MKVFIMMKKVMVIWICVASFDIQSSDYEYQVGVGEKRSRIASNNRRVKPRLASLEEALSMQIDAGNINGAIDMLDDIVIEGFLTPVLADQINEYIKERDSVSPIPNYFQPIQEHLNWLVNISNK